MNSKFYKWCAVPQCKNTSIKTPSKLFVYVPNEKTTRYKWLKLARRDPTVVSPNSSIYFCEDHFDLPNDMDNYMEYHVMGSVSQVRMKPGCIPTKFECHSDSIPTKYECQPDRRKRSWNTIERPKGSKPARKDTTPADVIEDTISCNDDDDVNQEDKKNLQTIELHPENTTLLWETPVEAVYNDPGNDPISTIVKEENFSLHSEEETDHQSEQHDVSNDGTTRVEEMDLVYACNYCKKNITGFRYHCVQCADCDLCALCEAGGYHPEHYVLRIPQDRPHAEVQSVLSTIRSQLLGGDNPLLDGEGEKERATDDALPLSSVKQEIKEEVEDPDPLRIAEPEHDHEDEYHMDTEISLHEYQPNESHQQNDDETDNTSCKQIKEESNDPTNADNAHVMAERRIPNILRKRKHTPKKNSDVMKKSKITELTSAGTARKIPPSRHCETGNRNSSTNVESISIEVVLETESSNESLLQSSSDVIKHRDDTSQLVPSVSEVQTEEEKMEDIVMNIPKRRLKTLTLDEIKDYKKRKIMASKSYTPESLQKALEEIKNGTKSVYKASKIYKIPNQTLYDKIHEKYKKQNYVGGPTVLTANEEARVVEWVILMTQMGFSVTKDIILHSVQKLVADLGRPNKFKDGLPGRYWYKGFLRRNSRISERVSRTLTTARVGATEVKIRAWFQRVRLYFEENDLLEVLEDPSRIFNCDEFAFFLCPKGQAVLDRTGTKSVYCRSGNDDKENLTLSLGASADGKLMPILALFSYKRIPGHILAKYPKTWSIGRSDKGWMTCETFYEYITNVFDPFLIKENIQKPVVLFLDGHVSHLSLYLCQYCKENGIILVALLPSSTYALQPMDVAIFPSLKNAWGKRVHAWRMENNGRRLKREDFGPVLEKPIQETLKQEKIKNGFRKCGLYPFDENAVDYGRLITSKT